MARLRKLLAAEAGAKQSIALRLTVKRPEASWLLIRNGQIVDKRLFSVARLIQPDSNLIKEKCDCELCVYVLASTRD